ncbi:hypothetical protein SUGI_0329200 [Cryptomeria japonica]|nr:hypothetical protein SUGI_0329200 [Cryptomeria japonica]
MQNSSGPHYNGTALKFTLAGPTKIPQRLENLLHYTSAPKTDLFSPPIPSTSYRTRVSPTTTYSIQSRSAPPLSNAKRVSPHRPSADRVGKMKNSRTISSQSNIYRRIPCLEIVEKIFSIKKGQAGHGGRRAARFIGGPVTAVDPVRTPSIR